MAWPAGDEPLGEQTRQPPQKGCVMSKHPHRPPSKKRNQLRRRAGLVASGATLLAAMAAQGAAPGVASAGPAPSVRLQHELDAIVAAGATGVTAEIDTGQHHLRESSGAAVAGSDAPVPVDARFRMGSVTKAFVATVVLQLVAEHRLGLDDPVSSVLPGVLPYADLITVRELLNHTSGVPEYLRTLPSPRSAEFLALRWRTWTAAELVARVADQDVLFEPGTQARYSNTNYLLLGMIIERITGHTYATEIRHRIIRPLHLTHTTVPGTVPYLRGAHAHGYLTIGGDLVDITDVNPSIMGASGEMISTTRDVNSFFEALFGGRLLPPALLEEMRTPAVRSPYGLGLIIRTSRLCAVPAYGKDGDAPGYSTWSFHIPGRSITVSVNWGTAPSNGAVNAMLDSELCLT
jgi:D-alanyl-D-alanine carboxypeptidase